MTLGAAARPAYGHEPLVGRDDELRVLEQALAELERGPPATIELVGEPGIGKTRLLAELAARAELRGYVVLSGSASELERELPFSVFVHALDEYVESLAPDRLSTLGDDVQAELAHVLPSLSALAGGREVALQHERYRSHRAVRALLELLAQAAPLVFMLDDLHWADSASVELLGALLRRPPAAAVLMAVVLRPHQTPERLVAALERARDAATLTRLELGALTPDQARALLGKRVDAADAAALYDESGGNPFYLEQLARGLGRPGGATSAAEISVSGLEIPMAVAASLSGELALLSHFQRLVLESAAVAGDPFEPELAAAAAATSEAAAMDALDELLRRDLIRPTDVPRRFRFRHPLVWRAVYETTAGGWRLGAHERCADALAARGVGPAGRAHHVERSARHGDVEAVAVLRAAGEAATRLAPWIAARWYGAALRLLPETAPNEERVALLIARAGCLAATGHFAESHAALVECIAIASEDWLVRATTACAAVERLLGLQSEAHNHLATALAELTCAESPEAVELMIELTVDALHAGDLDAARSWAQRAVGVATPLDDRALRAAALAVRAWAGAFAGDCARAETQCDEATKLVDELPDSELARRLDALAHLAGADLYLDRFAAATRHGERALRLGRATGQGDLFPLVVAMLGTSLWVQGRPLEAEELFDGAVEAARLSGSSQGLALNLFNRSTAALVAGNPEVALATAEESFDLLEEMEPGLISVPAAVTYAYALLETGQAERSVDVFLTRAGGEELRLVGGGWRTRYLEVLTRALLATDRRAQAERAARAAQAWAAEVALPTATAMASLATAAVALDSGTPTTAAVQALAAVAAFEAVGALFDAARAHELAGRALAQAGDLDGATRELELAAASFDSFGSLRYRDQAERELRRLGRHVHRRTRPGARDAHDLAALTARELEIAWLVVDRKTNPQIAAELFLSLKTVQTHLRNIFRKLGITSRVELARAVERAEHTAHVS